MHVKAAADGAHVEGIRRERWKIKWNADESIGPAQCAPRVRSFWCSGIHRASDTLGLFIVGTGTIMPP